MFTNIFNKSMARQPMRSILLFALIGVAAFAFILRTVEYIVIHRHIHLIGQNYRAIGFLQTHGETDNVAQAADLLSASPFMGYQDRRRRFQGFLRDIYSPDVAGMERHLPPEERRLSSAVFFYAEISSMCRNYQDDGLIQLTLRTTEVLAGSPNHITHGQRTIMYFEIPPDGDTSYIDKLSPGEIHLFKGHFYRPFVFITPQVGRTADYLAMQLLPSPEEMQAQIEVINRDSRAVTLQTTADMTTLPDLQGRRSPMSIQQGRLLDRNDYVQANPVAVIHQNFAWMRGLTIGDTITVAVYQNQYMHSVVPSLWQSGEAIVAARTELVIASSPEASGYIEIELEIVGIYGNFFRIDRTLGCALIYVPDSIIPTNIHVATPEHLPDDYLPAGWFGFVLNSTRDEQAFFLQYRYKMVDYNITLNMFRSGAEVFWAAADSILLMTAFNAFVFGFVVLLILVLVSFLYAKQRQREFAISRSLGASVKKILFHMCISVFMVGLPGVIIGGGVAWHFALEEAARVLEPFAENLSPYAQADPFSHDFVGAAIMEAALPEFSFVWLIVLVGGFFAFILALILFNVHIHLRRPVLEQLQGRSATKTWGKAANVLDEEVPDYAGATTFASLPKFEPEPKSGAIIRHSCGWIFTHAARSPVKTVLVIVIALFFIIALGWLQESIRRAEDEIEYLYDNTVVQAELETWGGHFLGYVRINRIMETGYFDTVNTDTFHEMSFVVPKDAHGNAPENWQEIIGFTPGIRTIYNIEAGIFEYMIGTSDLEEFIALHSVRLMGDDAAGLVIDFAEGFDATGFTYDDTTPIIPIIISQNTAYEWGMSLGEIVTLAYNRLPVYLSPWHFLEAKVVGIHNQHIHLGGVEEGIIVPTAVIESVQGGMTMYYGLRLTVDTAFNRELDNARHAVYYHFLRLPRHSHMRMLFYDEELRNMVGAMSQILILLELLYPIAVGLAIAVGAVVGLVLMLQMALNAALLRVLGASKLKTCIMLCMEQFAVCIVGLGVGFVVLMGLSWGFGAGALLVVAGVYLGSVVIGSVVGAVIITGKAPIDLLQVRE